MTTEQILILILAVVGFVVANFVCARYRHEFIVTDGFPGLLYNEGKLIETLVAGRRHVRWGKQLPRRAHRYAQDAPSGRRPGSAWRR